MAASRPSGTTATPVGGPRLLSALSVRARLVGVLGSVVVAGVGVGVVATLALSSIDEAGTAIYDEGLVPVVQLAKVRADMKDLRIAILNYVVSTAPEAKATQKANIAKAETAFDADLDAYRSHSVDAAGVADLEGAWGAYRSAVPDLLALGDAKDFPAYAALRDRTAVPASKAADAALLALTERQSQAAAARRDAAHHRFRTGRAWLLVLCSGLALLAGVGGVLVARGVLRPLASVRDALARVSSGDLTARAPVHWRDELAELATSVNTTVASIATIVSDVSATTSTLTDASSELTSLAADLDATADTAAQRADAAAGAVNEVHTAVRTMAVSTDQLDTAVAEIARSATEASRVAGEAVDAVGTATAGIAALRDSSEEIGDVLRLITSIAEQTNLLALNATIESARAGEAGRGFAVVANEVKELAQETGRATSDIGSRIETIQRDARAAIDAVEAIAAVIGRITEHQQVIAAAVEEQASTTRSLSSEVGETSQRSEVIAGHVADVAATAERTRATVQQARSRSEDLAVTAASLRLSVSGFRLDER
ncbi:MAG: methyl-accepting chemotaxis protein [Kineosporiaceae bacterium]